MNISAPSSAPRAFYVATDLASFEPEEPELYAPDVVIQGKAYRRLDPAYYAWLKHRLGLVEKAKDDGRVPPATYEALVRRFHTVHVWGMEHLGQDALDAAIGVLDPSAYTPPFDSEATATPAASVGLIRVPHHEPRPARRPGRVKLGQTQAGSPR